MEPISFEADGQTYKLPHIKVPPFSFEPEQCEIILGLLPESGNAGLKFIAKVEEGATGLIGKNLANEMLGIPSPADLRKKLEYIEKSALNLRDTLAGLEETVERHTVARALGFMADEDAYPFIDEMVRKLAVLSTCLEKMLDQDIEEYRSVFEGDETSIKTPEQIHAHMIAQSLEPLETKRGRPIKRHEVDFIRTLARNYENLFQAKPKSSRNGPFSELCSTILQMIFPNDFSDSPEVYRIVERALAK